MTVQTIAGIMGLQDSERLYLEGVGQRAVFEATQQYVGYVNEDHARVTSLFIERTTEDHAFRYYLPADGELQRVSTLGRPAERKVTGSWDVALPLEGFGDAIGTSRVELAYMTLADWQRHVDGVALRAQNTLRKEILRALLDNVNWSFEDELRGTLTIKALANQDGTLYPPQAGEVTAAQRQNYLESGYLVSGISDTNNPIKTISRALRDRFSIVGPNRRRLVLIATDLQDKVESLTDFVPVDDPNIRAAITEQSLLNVPGAVPGEVIGYANDAYISVWPWLPNTYAVGIDLGGEKPLQMRVDPGYTNLPRGLALITTDENFPLSKSDWQWRFGLGVVNRLNGYIMEVANGGSYSVPSGYCH